MSSRASKSKIKAHRSGAEAPRKVAQAERKGVQAGRKGAQAQSRRSPKVPTAAAGRRVTEAAGRQADAMEAERLRLFSVLNMLPGFVFLRDLDHTIRFANFRFLDIFGDPAGKLCYQVLHGRDTPCQPCPSSEVLAGDKPREWEWSSPAGRDYHVWAYPFSEVDGTMSVLELGIDVTERRELEKEILEAGTEEQRRIGRDLHDVLGQNLAGIAFLSKALAKRLHVARSPDADQAQEIAGLCNQAVAQARVISHGLSPVEVKAEGLMESLAGMAAGVERLYGIPCKFHCESPIHVLNSAVAGHLYHIVREAVGNATKHARPKHIRVMLLERDGTVRIEVRDDGVGIPGLPGPHGGMGLRIMRYRADMIRATLAVTRPADGGTSVECSLPLDRLTQDR